MKVKDVCIITNLAPWRYGGIETVIRELNEQLSKEGYKFTIFCHDKYPSVKKYPYGTVYCIKEKFLYFGILPPDFEYALNILSKKFDIIHAHYQTVWYPLIRRFMKKIPYIVTFHGIPLKELFIKPPYLNFDGKLRRLLGYVFERFSANSSDVVVACSKSVKEDLIKFYGIPKNKIRVIYNGVDVKKFRPINKDKCRKMLKLDKDTFYGLSVMTEPKRKGLDILMGIVDILKKSNAKKVKIIIIGQKGVDDDYVSFHERVPYDELALYYNSANLFIYPSFYNGLPLVTLLALACGVPIIVSENTKMEHIKNGKEGYIIDKLDPNMYFEKIIFLSQNKDILDSMSKAARETALRVSWENQAREYKKLYTELLKKK